MLNAWGRLDVWVTSSGLLGPPSIDATTPADLQKCFEANSLAPFFALKYAPPAMGKLTPKGHYPNAAAKEGKYGSIIVVSSVASTYGGKSKLMGHLVDQGWIMVSQFGSAILEKDRILKSTRCRLIILCLGCWGPCYTMSSHAALGVVRAGVAVLKGNDPRSW